MLTFAASSAGSACATRFASSSMESGSLRRACGSPFGAGTAFIESMSPRTTASPGEAARAVSAAIITMAMQNDATAALEFTRP